MHIKNSPLCTRALLRINTALDATSKQNRQSTRKTDVCRCRNYIYLKSPNAAALPRTECGTGRHCKAGECVVVNKTENTIMTTTAPTTATTSTAVTSTTGEPIKNQVFFPTRTLSICQFFRYFGVELDYCSTSDT